MTHSRCAVGVNEFGGFCGFSGPIPPAFCRSGEPLAGTFRQAGEALIHSGFGARNAALLTLPPAVEYCQWERTGAGRGDSRFLRVPVKAL